MKFKSVHILSLLASLLPLEVSAHSITLNEQFSPQYIQSLNDDSAIKIRSHGFHQKGMNLLIKPMFSVENGSFTIKKAITNTLYNNFIHPFVKVRQKKEEVNNLTQRMTAEFDFLVNGYPICGFYLKSFSQFNEDPMVVGKVPSFTPEYRVYENNDFPAVGDGLYAFKESMQMDSEEAVEVSTSRCLQIIDGVATPALQMKASISGLPYSFVTDGNEIFSLNKEFFSLSGTVKAYQKNPKDGVIADFPVELNNANSLSNKYFKTTTGSLAKAESTNGVFSYTNADEEFAEANAFAHANDMLNWYLDRGYNFTTSPITLRLREEIPVSATQTSPNNALYLTAGFDGTSGPTIAVGDGDGVILKNLAYDMDVVSHELGHHIVFRTLKSTVQKESSSGLSDSDDHSGALHEGLADYFAFAHTNDSCLAESICPDNSYACWEISSARSCLRSGSSSLKYGTPQYWSLGSSFHLKGQVVSGFLWDTREDSGVNKGEFDRLVLNALDYLPKAGVYTDLVVALMSSDKELFAGKYGCKIYEKAVARGFESLIKDEVSDCKNFIITEKSSVKATSKGDLSKIGASPAPSTSTKKKSNDSSSSFCGTIAVSAPLSTKGSLMLLLFLLSPVLLGFSRSEAVKVKSTYRKN